jgi:LAS superfamily LD-carboxypeptidase LdcB
MAYPVVAVTRPSVLAGQSNGQLDERLLVDVPGLDGGPTVRLVKPAAMAWEALTAAAAAAGHILKAVGPFDSYRPYSVQEKIFRERYTTTRLPGRPTKTWLGRTWWQKPGTAIAAVPGTSNHGWAITVDAGQENDGDPGAEPISGPALEWLLEHEQEFGFSHELQSEPWHIRYFAGDRLPDAVLAHHGPTQPPAQPPAATTSTRGGAMYDPTKPGRADDFAVIEGNVWHRWTNDNGATWESEVLDDGEIVSNFEAARDPHAPGKIRLSGIGTDGKFYERLNDGAGWTAWSLVGGQV